MIDIVPTSKIAAEDLSVALTEGGLLTFERALVPHVHVEIDDPITVFGLVIPVHDAAGGLAHVFEHMVMRHDSGNGELQHLWEANCSTGCWNVITTSRCISFDVASYTMDCLRRCSESLTRALFQLRIDPGQFESETDGSRGELTRSSLFIGALELHY